MKKSDILFLILVALTIFGCSQPEITNQEYVARYKGVFTRPAQHIPTKTVPDGPLSGNGDLGIVIGGKPDSQTIYISKVDFWKAKRGYPEGGVCLPGGLNISIPELKGATFYAEQFIADGTVKEVLKKDGITFHLSIFVPAGNNSVIMNMYNDGKSDCHVNLDLWAKTGLESKNRSGEQQDVFWVSRSFDSTDLDWPSHIVMAMKTIGAGGRDFVLKQSERVSVVIAASTNHDTPDYYETAIQNARNASIMSIEALKKTNNEWWKNFWDESLVEIGDTTMEKYYYGAQYILACCSRNINFPPGLWGNTLTMDATFDAWEGDYHTDYNHQAPWWGAYSSNHISISDPYDQPVLDYIEPAKVHAKKLLNCSGVYYPAGIGPKGFCSSMYPLTPEKMMKYYGVPDTGLEGGYMFCGMKSNAVFLANNMLMRFYSTYDTAYAKKVYPFLKEVANFWDEYLKYENGRYVIHDDSFQEVGPWEGGKGGVWRSDFANLDFNPTSSLGYLHMFYKGIIDLSTFLRLDLDRQEKWNSIFTHLSLIPTEEVDGNIRIKACESGKGQGSRIKPGLGLRQVFAIIFPTDFAGIYTDSSFTAILRKEIDRWGHEDRKGMEPAWGDVSADLVASYQAANRVGFDPDITYRIFNERIKKAAFPNLWIAHGGGGVETCSAVPSFVNEMLLQSYEGVIRVFPAWLKNRDAKFETLRAYGAFLISSEIKNDKVTYIKIISEKGRLCTLENPWSKTGVVLTRNGHKAETLTGKLIKFETKAGESINLKPI
jgi:alpha-L-fucosidase 2